MSDQDVIKLAYKNMLCLLTIKPNSITKHLAVHVKHDTLFPKISCSHEGEDCIFVILSFFNDKVLSKHTFSHMHYNAISKSFKRSKYTVKSH